MTYEEASTAIKTWCNAMKRANINNEFAMEFIKAAETAILPLEKQMPKKVAEGVNFCEYRCPCCGFVFDGTMPFCLSCGQALDWSE